VNGTRPDLVLMDIGLKGNTDGIEAAKKIRNHYHIQVVFQLLLTFFERKSESRMAFSRRSMSVKLHSDPFLNLYKQIFYFDLLRNSPVDEFAKCAIA